MELIVISITLPIFGLFDVLVNIERIIHLSNVTLLDTKFIGLLLLPQQFILAKTDPFAESLVITLLLFEIRIEFVIFSIPKFEKDFVDFI